MKTPLPEPTLTELAMLGAVLKLNHRGTCAALGDFLWGQFSKRGYSNCSCPYARPAGRVLASLVRRGLVQRHHDAHATMFRATRAGERTYAKDPALTRWKGTAA